MKEKTIDVAKEFSHFPYGRYYPDDGDYCGQKFREDFLKPALHSFDKVIVDLSGTNNYGSSFLDESFGGLIRIEGYELKDLEKCLEIKHELLPSLLLQVKAYMQDAENERKN